MQLLANVMFPAFMTPYIAPLFMPLMLVWILGSEWKMLVYLLEKDTIRDNTIEIEKGWVFVMVLGANVLSSAAGMLLAPHLPTGLNRVEKTAMDGTIYSVFEFNDSWGSYVKVSYVLAYALSIAIEGGVLRFSPKRFRVSKAWKKSWLINSVSYGGILLFYVLTTVLDSF